MVREYLIDPELPESEQLDPFDLYIDGDEFDADLDEDWTEDEDGNQIPHS